MNRHLLREVRLRANGRCEYCGIPSLNYRLPFQVDHITARQHGGATRPGSLALACFHCNRHKGPNVAGLDPATGQVVRLFHPRTDSWIEHFRLEGATITGQTAVGRATVQVLAMNHPEFAAVRDALMMEGVYRSPTDAGS